MGPIPNEQRDHPNQNSDSDIESAEHPDVMINIEVTDSDSDDDEDAQGYMGYQALSQDVGMVGQDSDSDEENQLEGAVMAHDGSSSFDSAATGVQVPEGLTYQLRNTSNVAGYMQVPELPRPDKKDLLWNQARQTDISLETGHAEKIKSLMSGIQLPTANIPDWARNMSEEDWQEKVVKVLTTSGTSPKQEVDQVTNQTADSVQSASQTLSVTESNCDHSSAASK